MGLLYDTMWIYYGIKLANNTGHNADDPESTVAMVLFGKSYPALDALGVNMTTTDSC